MKASASRTRLERLPWPNLTITSGSLLQRTPALPAGLRSVPLGHREGVAGGATPSRCLSGRECACEEQAQPDESLPGTVSRKAAAPGPVTQVPASVSEVVRAPGQPLEASTLAWIGPRFGHDFSRVRVHAGAQAARSAGMVDALAYTLGEHLVFAAGRYAPRTAAGRRLLAHELAHVVQQSGKPAENLTGLALSRPADPAEVEAERAAQAVVSGKEVALPRGPGAPGILQRQQAGLAAAPQTAPPPPAAGAFTGEDPALAARRTGAIGVARRAIQGLTGALSNGYLWSFETPTATGVDLTSLWGTPTQETHAQRRVRLRRLINDLISMVMQLERAPVPAAWLAQPVVFPPRGNLGISLGNQAEQDAQIIYAHRASAAGVDFDVASNNTYYIQMRPVPTAQTARMPLGGGIGLGIYIVVDDPDRAPLVYHRLTQYEPWSGPGVIMEVWHDSFGYYYPYHGQKIYLPGRPT